MDFPGRRFPHTGRSIDEGLDLDRCQLEPLFPDGRERLGWCGDESAAQIFVGEDLTNEELHGSLRHFWMLPRVLIARIAPDQVPGTAALLTVTGRCRRS